MSLDNSKVLIATQGTFWTAAVDTAYPASPDSPGAPWANLGHTSADNPFTVKRDGGDVTTNGTWQSPNLRTSTAPITYSIQFTALQADANVFKFYFGGGTLDGSTPARWIVPTSPASQATALYVILQDTGASINRHWYFPNTSVIGSDDAAAATDDFLGFPLSFTILNDVTLSGLFGIDFQ